MTRHERGVVATVARTLAWLALGGALACKLEPVYDLVPGPDPMPQPQPGPTIPEAVPIEEDRSQIRAEIARQLTALSGPALAGRRPGTEGGAATVEWLETSMRKIGLIPDGVGGGWQQPVVVRLDVTEAADIELPRVMEDEPPDVLTQGQQVLLWRAGDKDRWAAELAIVEAGHGISAPGLGHDDYAELDVRGKVVLVEAGLPAALTEREADDDLPEAYDSLEYKLAQARLAGAAGCLITSEAVQDEPGWRALRRRFATRDPDEAQDPAVLASVGLEVAGVVSAGAEASLRTWIGATRLREATGAPPTLARFTVDSEKQTLVAANVVGRVPGDEHPEEVVVVMAHWDAGGASAPLADGGAMVNNASGVAVMLGVARLVVERLARGDAPARSIVFAATASDTLGLAGARALVRTGPLSSAKLIALVSLDDMVAREGESTLSSIDAAKAGLADVLEEASGMVEAIKLERGPDPELGHQPALELGVPAITLTRHDPERTVNAVEGPAQSPVSEEALTTMVEDAVTTFELVWGLATSQATPSTRADDEPEPEPEPAPEQKPAPEQEPATEQKHAPEREPAPDETPAAQPEPGAESKPGPEPKPKTRPKPKPKSEKQPANEAEPGGEPTSPG